MHPHQAVQMGCGQWWTLLEWWLLLAHAAAMVSVTRLLRLWLIAVVGQWDMMEGLTQAQAVDQAQAVGPARWEALSHLLHHLLHQAVHQAVNQAACHLQHQALPQPQAQALIPDVNV